MGTAAQLTALERWFDVRDVAVLAHTFPRWKRALTWLLWETPIVFVVERRFRSPYGLLHARLCRRAPVVVADEERTRPTRPISNPS